MLRVGDPTSEECEAIVGGMDTRAASSKGVENLYASMTQVVSGLSRCVGLVLTPSSVTPMKHIEFVRIEPTTCLVVMVTSDGMVENRVINLPAGLPDYALQDAANWINGNLRGLTLDEAMTKLRELVERHQATLDVLTQKVVSTGIAAWTQGTDPGDRNLIVRGRGNLVAEQDTWSDINQLRTLLDDMGKQAFFGRFA